MVKKIPIENSLIISRVAVGFEPDLNTMKNSDIIMARVFTDINGQQITEVHDCFALDVGVCIFL